MGAKSRAFAKSQHGFPHRRTGGSMYPEKPADPRRCVLCNRMVADVVFTETRSLCPEHRKGRNLKIARELRDAQVTHTVPRKVDRRPGGRVIHPSVR